MAWILTIGRVFPSFTAASLIDKQGVFEQIPSFPRDFCFEEVKISEEKVIKKGFLPFYEEKHA